MDVRCTGMKHVDSFASEGWCHYRIKVMQRNTEHSKQEKTDGFSTSLFVLILFCIAANLSRLQNGNEKKMSNEVKKIKWCNRRKNDRSPIGLPTRPVSDSGTPFIGAAFQELSENGIYQGKTAIQAIKHHQVKGLGSPAQLLLTFRLKVWLVIATQRRHNRRDVIETRHHINGI